MKYLRVMSVSSSAAVLLALGALAATGCDDDETVLDVETPGIQVEVERDPDANATQVEVTDNE